MMRERVLVNGRGRKRASSQWQEDSQQRRKNNIVMHRSEAKSACGFHCLYSVPSTEMSFLLCGLLASAFPFRAQARCFLMGGPKKIEEENGKVKNIALTFLWMATGSASNSSRVNGGGTPEAAEALRVLL